MAQSVGGVLQYVVEHGSDPEAIVWWWDPDCGPVGAVPGGDVFRVKDHRKEVVLDVACSRDAFMARNAGDYLRGSHGLALKSLFRCLCKRTDADFIRRITEDDRRWWIGSLLDLADHGRLLTADDYARFALIWQKMLRRYDCGKRLPTIASDAASVDFPILPADDSVGVWTAEESYFLVD